MTQEALQTQLLDYSPPFKLRIDVKGLNFMKSFIYADIDTTALMLITSVPFWQEHILSYESYEYIL